MRRDKRYPLSDQVAAAHDIDFRDGYEGAFTRECAPGALASGTRIAKANSEKGDTTPDGTGGVILGSIGHPELGLLYFIEWDDKPKVATAVIGLKVMAVQGRA